MNLEELGYSEHFARQLQALGDPSLAPYRVAIEYMDRYQLLGESGPAWGYLRGGLHERGPYERPAVGDWIAGRGDPAGDLVVIQELLERRSRFVRQAAGKRTRPQVVAANVDLVFVVTSCNLDFNVRRIERYLTTVWDSGASPVLVLNKADLIDDPEQLVHQLGPLADNLPVAVVSATEAGGLEELEQHLARGRTIALVGSSGVGKSTIVNRLIGREVQKIADVRADDDKGRHTTTHRELIPIGERGILIDTPGMRELQLWVDEDAIDTTFADIEELAEQCRFRDCEHESEPGCAVREAVERGELEAERFEAYRKLGRELAAQQQKIDTKARREELSRWKSVSKSGRRYRKPRGKD